MWSPDKIIGAACGLGIKDRSGSALAPDAISKLIKHDIILSPEGESSMQEYLLHLYNEIVTAKDPLVFGGDHSVAIATWQAALQNHGDDFALVWLDAHLDANNFDTSPSGNYHGMPLATLLGHCKELEFKENFKYLKPENLYILGARDYEEGEYELLKSLNVNLYMMSEFDKVDLNTVMNDICSRHKEIGISFDCDAIDSKYFPYVNTPVSHGFNIDELSDAIEIASKQLIGLEITEYNPLLDRNQRGPQVIYDILSWIVF